MTPKHDRQAVLRYIIRYKAEWGGDSPSIREIGAQFGIGSTSLVRDILGRLEADGSIKRRPGRTGIMVDGMAWEYLGDDSSGERNTYSEAKRRGNQAAIDLLQSWESEDAQDQRETWEALSVADNSESD